MSGTGSEGERQFCSRDDQPGHPVESREGQQQPEPRTDQHQRRELGCRGKYQPRDGDPARQETDDQRGYGDPGEQQPEGHDLGRTASEEGQVVQSAYDGWLVGGSRRPGRQRAASVLRR